MTHTCDNDGLTLHIRFDKMPDAAGKLYDNSGSAVEALLGASSLDESDDP